MRRESKRNTVLVAASLAAFLLLGNAAEAKGPRYDTSLPARMTHKLLRGVTNVFLGVVEVPLAINEEVQLLDPFTGTFTGVCKGSWRACKRIGVGAYEVVTFPIPAPARYRAIIEPEIVMLDHS